MRLIMVTQSSRNRNSAVCSYLKFCEIPVAYRSFVQRLLVPYFYRIKKHNLIINLRMAILCITLTIFCICTRDS